MQAPVSRCPGLGSSIVDTDSGRGGNAALMLIINTVPSLALQDAGVLQRLRGLNAPSLYGPAPG